MPNFILLEGMRRKERARGFARFILVVNGEEQIKYGIVAPDTGRRLMEIYNTKFIDKDVALKELTEKELMDKLISGWKMIT